MFFLPVGAEQGAQVELRKSSRRASHMGKKARLKAHASANTQRNDPTPQKSTAKSSLIGEHTAKRYHTAKTRLKARASANTQQKTFSGSFVRAYGAFHIRRYPRNGGGSHSRGRGEHRDPEKRNRRLLRLKIGSAEQICGVQPQNRIRTSVLACRFFKKYQKNRHKN